MNPSSIGDVPPRVPPVSAVGDLKNFFHFPRTRPRIGSMVSSGGKSPVRGSRNKEPFDSICRHRFSGLGSPITKVLPGSAFGSWGRGRSGGTPEGDAPRKTKSVRSEPRREVGPSRPKKLPERSGFRARWIGRKLHWARELATNSRFPRGAEAVGDVSLCSSISGLVTG